MMGYVKKPGLYRLDIYCDIEENFNGSSEINYSSHWNHQCNPFIYMGNSFTECIQEAKKDGWFIKSVENYRDIVETNIGVGTCICPKHVKQMELI